MRLESEEVSGFRKFLYARSAAPRLIDDALTKTIPLIDRAAEGKFTLKPAAMFRQNPKVRERLEEAVRLATGSEITAVAYAALAKPAGEALEWLPDDLYPRVLHEGLMNALERRLEDFLRESRGGHDELAEDVWTSLWSLTGLDLWRYAVGHAEGTYGACLVEYLCAAVRNDEARKDRLEALIDAMHYCLPLGTRLHEPGTWIVLTG